MFKLLKTKQKRIKRSKDKNKEINKLQKVVTCREVMRMT